MRTTYPTTTTACQSQSTALRIITRQRPPAHTEQRQLSPHTARRASISTSKQQHTDGYPNRCETPSRPQARGRERPRVCDRLRWHGLGRVGGHRTAPASSSAQSEGAGDGDPAGGVKRLRTYMWGGGIPRRIPPVCRERCERSTRIGQPSPAARGTALRGPSGSPARSCTRRTSPPNS